MGAKRNAGVKGTRDVRAEWMSNIPASLMDGSDCRLPSEYWDDILELALLDGLDARTSRRRTVKTMQAEKQGGKDSKDSKDLSGQRRSIALKVLRDSISAKLV